MKFRTTKQIINESLNGRDTWFISDEVWVGLESLKKEIKKHVYCPFPDGTCMISGGNCFHTLLDLCNSSEQSERSDNSMKIETPTNSVSVEHNTGEEIEKCNSDSEKQSRSSPVHSHQWFCGGKEPCVCMESWKEEQKKCTCPRPEPRLPEELLNNCCVRCGGVL